MRGTTQKLVMEALLEEEEARHRFAYGNSNGFPKKCDCGSDVVIYTSNSKLNPGRSYFRCGSSRESGHLFKWVEEGMYEEVQEFLHKYARNDELMALNEEVLSCKTEIEKLKFKNMVLLVGLCVSLIVSFW